AGSCVMLYAGNYGVAHEVDTVARGYALHHRQGSGRVRLWLSATGTGADELARELSRQGLPFHRSAPVPLERLAGLLRAPDLHLVTRKDSLVGYVMPTKIYAWAQSAGPLVFAGRGVSGRALPARAAETGYWGGPCGDAAAFPARLEEIADRR